MDPSLDSHYGPSLVPHWHYGPQLRSLHWTAA